MKNTKSTIPLALRAELNDEPEYSYCCVTGEEPTKDDPIEWHHNLKFAGCNVQRRFCILPIKRSIHLKADTREVRERLNWVMWSRATAEEIKEFSKATNYAHEKARLDSIFGIYKPPMRKKVSEPINDDKKPWWFKIGSERQSKLLKACKFHAEKEGISYTPYALLDSLIDDHYREVEKLEAEYGGVY